MVCGQSCWRGAGEGERSPSSQGRTSGVGPLTPSAPVARPRQAKGRPKKAPEQSKRFRQGKRNKEEGKKIHVTNIVHGARKECHDCRNGNPFTTSVGAAPFACDAPGARGIVSCAWPLLKMLAYAVASYAACKTQVETYPSRGTCA